MSTQTDEYGLSQENLTELLKVFGDFPDLKEVKLFGSRAMGTYKPGSDIDLAVYWKKADPQLTSSLHYKLEEETLLPYFIDVVEGSTLESEELKHHIALHGKILYKKY